MFEKLDNHHSFQRSLYGGTDGQRYLCRISQHGDNRHHAARVYYNIISDVSIPAYRIAALKDSEGKGGRLF